MRFNYNKQGAKQATEYLKSLGLRYDYLDGYSFIQKANEIFKKRSNEKN